MVRLFCILRKEVTGLETVSLDLIQSDLYIPEHG